MCRRLSKLLSWIEFAEHSVAFCIACMNDPSWRRRIAEEVQGPPDRALQPAPALPAISGKPL